MSGFRGKAFAVALATAGLAWSSLAAAPLASEPQAVDPGVRPGDDFYRYANGLWLKTTPLPEGRASYDTTAMLRDETAPRVRDLIEQAARAPASPRARRVGDYYASWLNLAAIDAKGLRPLSDELAAIAAIRDRRALATHLGRTLQLDDGTNTATESLLGVWIHQGFHDSDRYAPHLVQGGLGLAERDDYLEAAPAKAAVRDAYRAHVAQIMKLAGFDQPDLRAARVLVLEIAIARTHASRADTDDVFKTDNTWRRADFTVKAPGLDWDAYFKAAGLARQDDFVVWQPSAVTGAAVLASSQPIEAWKDYLAFHRLEHAAAALPKAFRDEQAEFAARLSGRPAATPDRAQQALDATTAALGQDIGQLYVERHFPPASKAAAEAMVEDIRSAFRTRVAGLAWMSPAAREMALAKLDTLKVGVGYPDDWIDYSGLAVARGDAYGNLRRAEAFAYQRALARLRRPVDPAAWEQVLPQKVGAVINFSPNSLQFSAALLQPPYFDGAGDAASNYGSAGAGMAHEIGHSLDELGSIYDSQGRLVRWWSPDDLARYRAASAPLTVQMAASCPRPDLCVNGEQVLGESIGDLTGLQVAYDAYVLSLKGRPETIKDGLTGDQRFFLAFARRWRRLQTDAALRQQIATDSHAPGEYRADLVRNLDVWQRAFDVKPGDKLYLRAEDRARIW